MSSSYGRLAAIRDYWMPRNLDARVEVRVTDIDEILRELVRVTTLAAERAAPTPPVQHSDDVAVDRFAATMKAKLAQKRAEGRGGWDDPEQCPIERLAELLHEHVSKGDPIDVANFAMMLWCRGGRTTPPVQQDDEALEPDMQSAWISVQDRMPPDDTPVLVYVPGNEMLAFAIDQWQMQREAPLGWSSATIETGMGWGDHDYEDVSHWMPLTAPGHPLDADDQGIVAEYDGLLRMIDEALGGNDASE